MRSAPAVATPAVATPPTPAPVSPAILAEIVGSVITSTLSLKVIVYVVLTKAVDTSKPIVAKAESTAPTAALYAIAAVVVPFTVTVNVPPVAVPTSISTSEADAIDNTLPAIAVASSAVPPVSLDTVSKGRPHRRSILLYLQARPWSLSHYQGRVFL